MKSKLIACGMLVLIGHTSIVHTAQKKMSWDDQRNEWDKHLEQSGDLGILSGAATTGDTRDAIAQEADFEVRHAKTPGHHQDAEYLAAVANNRNKPSTIRNETDQKIYVAVQNQKNDRVVVGRALDSGEEWTIRPLEEYVVGKNGEDVVTVKGSDLGDQVKVKVYEVHDGWDVAHYVARGRKHTLDPAVLLVKSQGITFPFKNGEGMITHDDNGWAIKIASESKK